MGYGSKSITNRPSTKQYRTTSYHQENSDIIRKNISNLIIDDDCKLYLYSNTQITDLLPCDIAAIKIVTQNTNYIIAKDCISDLLSTFIKKLSNSIINNLKPHSSITKDLGFLLNKDFHQDTDLDYNGDFWVGNTNLLWDTPSSTKPNLATWLYNSDDGSIILEVTPIYHWHFDDPKPGELWIPYEQFMETYQPLLLKTIPAKIAKQWLNQIQDLENQIKQNEQLTSI